MSLSNFLKGVFFRKLEVWAAAEYDGRCPFLLLEVCVEAEYGRCPVFFRLLVLFLDCLMPASFFSAVATNSVNWASVQLSIIIGDRYAASSGVAASFMRSIRNLLLKNFAGSCISMS